MKRYFVVIEEESEVTNSTIVEAIDPAAAVKAYALPQHEDEPDGSLRVLELVEVAMFDLRAGVLSEVAIPERKT